MNRIIDRIATEISARPQQVEAAVTLLDEGATVPFVARYRKEKTGGLDDTALRTLEQRLHSLRELEARRETILGSIREQGKLTESLEATIQAAETRTDLEDLYLPYRPKRTTKASLAEEAGLSPLADTLLAHPDTAPDSLAASFINPDKNVPDSKAALEGARWILISRFSEHADTLAAARERYREAGHLVSTRVASADDKTAARFRDYFDFREAFEKLPSHRILALLRGQREGVLSLNLMLSDENDDSDHPLDNLVRARQGIARSPWLDQAVRLARKAKLKPAIERNLVDELRTRAETDAFEVFGTNLKDLLLAAPAGPLSIIGLDPGLRTGVKLAVVDATGALRHHDTLFPHAPRHDLAGSEAKLRHAIETFDVSLVAVGNGTASRETERFVKTLIRHLEGRNVQCVIVSEAGASVYSASALAAEEFPDLDVSFRGAVSIARRLQDPLAELVKIEPRAMGVGQYQHDVNQVALESRLDSVVEDCVNAVGVDANTASAPLLSRVAGMSPRVARALVQKRDIEGPFPDRQALKSVPWLGDRTYEQCAGFLRIRGRNPLDRSGVHPEAYPLVDRICAATGLDIGRLLGNRPVLRALNADDFTDERFGLPTVRDIIAELEKPGRDPRPAFRSARFTDGVETLQDLRPDMRLEGTVTNVTQFGAFVDIGVHQDGLVHISELADSFVKNPSDVVRTGQIVQVRVLEVDMARKRISLSMKSDQSQGKPDTDQRRPTVQTKERKGRRQQSGKPTQPAQAKPESDLARQLRQLL